MTEWWQDLAAMQDQIWSCLADGPAGRRPAARFVSLATAGQSGGAETRMVVLRAADRATATLVIHTDTLSAKVAELRADPHATILCWDPDLRLQIRLKAKIGIETGTAASNDWQSLPETARRVYGGLPPPGQDIGAPLDMADFPDPSRFAVLTCTVMLIDALHLGRNCHQRAVYRRRDTWAGRWVAP